MQSGFELRRAGGWGRSGALGSGESAASLISPLDIMMRSSLSLARYFNRKGLEMRGKWLEIWPLVGLWWVNLIEGRRRGFGLVYRKFPCARADLRGLLYGGVPATAHCGREGRVLSDLQEGMKARMPFDSPLVALRNRRPTTDADNASRPTSMYRSGREW